jgi:hypothetical protein
VENWYYYESGNQKGPISEAQLQMLLQSGRLNFETPVWNESMQDWQEAGEIVALVHFHKSTSNPTQDTLYYDIPKTKETFIASGPQLRPIIRFLARLFDTLLYSLIVGFFIGLSGYFSVFFEEVDEILQSIIILFSYIFIEPVLLHIFGTTPGKQLFNISLKKVNGKALRFKDTLNRSFNLWLVGLGGGLPVISAITQILAFSGLSKEGTTYWDKRGGFIVEHRFVGAVRISIVITIIFLTFLLFLYVEEFL